VFVGSAFGWIFITELLRPNLRDLLVTSLKLAVSLVFVFMLFIALSPALWIDPFARIQDLVAERQKLIDIQVQADPIAPTTLLQRIEGIVTQPFLVPPMHFEVANWAEARPITAEIARYMASPISGIQFGWLFGLPLTLFAGAGILFCLLPAFRPRASSALSLGLLLWLGITALSLLVNPLPWQRYYLPLYPIVSLLAGIGLQTTIRLIVQKRKQNPSADRLPIGAS
jgi:hypothetical protein